MPLPFALPVGLGLGFVLAWVARGELGSANVPLPLTRAFLVTVAFACLVFVPMQAYFALFHRDWTYLYLLDTAHVASAVDLALILGGGLAVLAGFLIGARVALGSAGSQLWKVAVGVVVALLVLAALAGHRLSVSATFAQYHGGFGVVPISKSVLGRGVLSSWIMLAAGFGVTLHALRPRADLRSPSPSRENWKNR